MVVGDSNVGKSSLITKYLDNAFSEYYDPKVLSVKQINYRIEAYQ